MELLLPKQLDSKAASVHGFIGLMDLYEQNYIRLRLLIPDFAGVQAKAVSTVQGCLDLHYARLESSKYTTVFSLTHQFEGRQGGGIEPNLTIRVYHDARVAEVLSGDGFGRKAGLFGTDLNILQSKWRQNRFLYKWLNFCLKRGHRIVPYYPISNIFSSRQHF